MAYARYGTRSLSQITAPYGNRVPKGMMTVELRGIGSDITQVGGHANNPDNLAMVILSEMITKHLQKSVGR